MVIHWDKIVGGVSAVLSMVGTYLIWADAQRVNGKVVDVLMELTRKVGTWVDHPWTPQQQDELRSLERNSGMINKRGFILLIGGFFLQLVSLFL